MDYRYNFDDRKKHKRKKIIFIVIVLIIVVMFVALMFRHTGNAVVNKVASIVSAPIHSLYRLGTNVRQNLGSKFADSQKLSDENIKLQEEKKELEYKVLESQKIADENASLKEMLGIKKEFQHFNIKLGKVIYREHDNWTQTFQIDIGSQDGIKLDQAVVHQNGLVGYISNIEETTSTVTTILDPSSSVSVNISTINEPAILKGDLTLKSDNKLKLAFIPLDAEVSIADMLYTSGLGSMYPGSIPVGKIVEIKNNKNDMNRYAIVEPNVNIRTISEVGVIVN